MTDSLGSDEKRAILKKFNQDLNNNLQFILAYTKLQNRFGVDKDEIINTSCVFIASIAAIQNKKFEARHEKNLIPAEGFLKDYIGILNEYYSSIDFSINVKEEFYIKQKQLFHIIALINELINLSINSTFKEDSNRKISFSLEKNQEECTLKYSDYGFGIRDIISKPNMRSVLFEQLVKQIEGKLNYSNDNAEITINFPYLQ